MDVVYFAFKGGCLFWAVGWHCWGGKCWLFGLVGSSRGISDADPLLVSLSAMENDGWHADFAPTPVFSKSVKAHQRPTGALP